MGRLRRASATLVVGSIVSATGYLAHFPSSLDASLSPSALESALLSKGSRL